MSYQYDINNSIKDKSSKNSLFLCHSIFNIINVFISTFLIAHIYSFSGDIYDYIFKVCIYNLAHYVTMFLLYFVVAKIVDKTNRISIYRVSLIIRMILVVVFIFYGKQISQILLLAGFIRGLSDTFYYASYNVLKQEMVSRKDISNYSANIYVAVKVIDIICPIVLGALIDISTYSFVAIFVCIVCIVQFIISMFVKSQRPNESKFDMKAYFKAIKQSPEAYKKLKFIYLISFLYVSALVSMVLNICIMIEFKNAFSLGLITSILSVVSVLTIFIVRKLTRAGSRTWLFVLSALFLVCSATIFAFNITKWTIILYHSAIAIGAIIFKINYDAYRNGILKEAGLYNEISEHHLVMESIYNIVRILGFLIAILVAISKNLILFKVYFIIVSVIYASAFVLTGIYENKFLKEKSSTSNIDEIK